jgi:hypothetical protein
MKSQHGSKLKKQVRKSAVSVKTTRAKISYENNTDIMRFQLVLQRGKVIKITSCLVSGGSNDSQ